MDKQNKERQNVSAVAAKEPFIDNVNKAADKGKAVPAPAVQKGVPNKSLPVKGHLLTTKKDGGQDDTVQYITIAKGQQFEGKIIETDYELNRFAEEQMGITVPRNWNPKYSDEEVKGIVSTGKIIAYRFNLNDVNKGMELLPPEKKGFIANLDGMNTTLQKVRILDLLSQLSAADIADYKSKTNAESTDALAIEASLRAYIQQKNERLQEQSLLSLLAGELKGTDMLSLYKQYKEYNTAAPVSISPSTLAPASTTSYRQDQKRKEKNNQFLENLKQSGYTVETFRQLINDYELSFRRETLYLAQDALQKYSHILFKEQEKINNDAILSSLLQQIKQSGAKEAYKNADAAKSASNIITDEKPIATETAFKLEMRAKSASETQKGNAAINALSGALPLIKDNGFDKEAFSKIESKAALSAFLNEYIAGQKLNITETLKSLNEDDGLAIYAYQDLLQYSKAQQGIQKGDILDLIITDKENKESAKHLVRSLVIGVLAVALGLLTFGTGTIALLIAAGNFALGAYLTYEEIDAYQQQLAAYNVNISKDEPKAVWVILSVVGTALDLAAIGKISNNLVRAGNSFTNEQNFVKVEKELTEAGLNESLKKKVLQALDEENKAATTEIPIAENRVIPEEKITHKKLKTQGIPEEQLSYKGRDIPPLTSAELARVLEWQNVRNKFLKDWRELDFLDFSPELHNRIKKVINSIRKNLTPDDIAAVIKEIRGEKIISIDGIPYNHLQENIDAQNSIKNAIKELKKSLNTDIPNYRKYQALISDLSNLKDRMIEIIKS
ncbi:polymorphic toxin type 28 domain-containing protein [Flavobacterium sp.]|uniref:polymorphic toxin type 28 domain-containing protein n=1 Tax=Flavobacterium sp. TaxID=239 RepID=UPI002610598D|nr:polymorphic toxin type 28 domain-containing protein [Flavobacterium sp.]